MWKLNNPWSGEEDNATSLSDAAEQWAQDREDHWLYANKSRVETPDGKVHYYTAENRYARRFVKE